MKLLFENWRKYIAEEKELIQEFKQADKEALMVDSDRFTISYEIEILSNKSATLDGGESERPTLEEYAGSYLDDHYFSEDAGERDYEGFVEYSLLHEYDATGDGLVDLYVTDEITSKLGYPPDEAASNQIVKFEISVRVSDDGRKLYDAAIESISRDGSPEANAFIELLLNTPAIKEELAEFTEMKATQLGLDLDPEEETDKIIHILSGVDNAELFRRYVFDLKADISGFPSLYREGTLISLEDFFEEIALSDELSDALFDVDSLLEGEILELDTKWAVMNDAWNLSQNFKESSSVHLKEIASMVESAAETHMNENAEEEYANYQSDPIGYLTEMGFEVEERYEAEHGPIYDEYGDEEFDEGNMEGLMRRYLPNFMNKYAHQLNYKPDPSLNPEPHVEFSMENPPYIKGLQEALDFLELFFEDFEKQDNFYMDGRTGLHTNVGYLEDEGELNKNYNLMKALLFLNRDFATKGFESRRGSSWAGSVKRIAIEEITTQISREIAGEYKDQESISPTGISTIIKNFVAKDFDKLDKTLSNVIEYSVRHHGGKNLGFNIKYIDNRGYVEFRYPGSGTLNYEIMKNTTLYYAHIIKVATDPEYKKSEYIKKLIGFINNLKHVEYEKITSYDEIKALKRGKLLILPATQEVTIDVMDHREHLFELYKYLTSETEREMQWPMQGGSFSVLIDQRDLWPSYFVYKGLNAKAKSVILEHITWTPGQNPHYMIAEVEKPMIFFERQMKEQAKSGAGIKNAAVEKLILGMHDVLRKKGQISFDEVEEYRKESQDIWDLRDKLRTIKYNLEHGYSWQISAEDEKLHGKYAGIVLSSPPSPEQQELRQMLRKRRVADDSAESSSSQHSDTGTDHDWHGSPLTFDEGLSESWFSKKLSAKSKEEEGVSLQDLQEDIDFSALQLKDTLEPNLWQNDELNSQIREKLKEIALDFWEKTELTDIDIIDIIVTGSTANYNWTKYSDIDLHIIINLAQVDDNVGLVNRFFRYMSSSWNRMHKIMIKGHEVEIYVQDVNEIHASTGMYSVLNGYWTVKPSKTKVQLDKEAIRRKAEVMMVKVDAAEKMYAAGQYQEAHETAVEIKEKIRNMRRCGLTDGGEFSAENLAFKVLRRNGYLAKLSELKNDAYDKTMSLDGVHSSSIKIKIGG